MAWKALGRGSGGRAKLAAIMAVVAIGLFAVATQFGSSKGSVVGLATRAPEYGRLPMSFIANRGQVDATVRYIVKAPDLTAHFTDAGAVLNLRETRVRIGFAEANPAPRIEALQKLPGTVNFFVGHRPEQWRTDIPTYQGIVYREVYPGFDAFYFGSEGWLKSEFVAAPGADLSLIRLVYSGVDQVHLDESGDLVLVTDAGELREAKPEIYQEIEENRVQVEGGFRLVGGNQVGFEVGAYNHAYPLIIDPMLSYSTYLGGSGLDAAQAIGVDGLGNVYVAGQTDSFDFPVANPMQSTSGGGVDTFVAKLNLAGNALVYCTYIGGKWDDRAFGVAVDGSGAAYVTGRTSSSDFPTTTGARQRVLGGGRDAFVAKLSATGNQLVYSTYIGGGSHDSGKAIALDSSGNAYVAGNTRSGNFPVINAFQTSNGGQQDAFISKLSADGSALLWSTYLGGYGDDSGRSIALDSAGSTYLTGGTGSANFPTYNALQSSSGGGQDAFVTKLSADGKVLIYSTYLGGSSGSVGAGEMGTGIDVDAAGNAYVTGTTSSLNFPVVNALQSAHAGGLSDAFVAKLNSTGSSLLYSTYLGGASVDYARGISVNLAGIACVVGYTASTNFPTLNPLQPTNAGGYDAFAAKLSPQGDALESATYWGGSDSDVANAVFMEAAGNAWIGGQTASTNFPLKNAIQLLNAGRLGAFVTKMGELTPTAVFRANNGNTMLASYGSTGLYNAVGFITCEPGISQNVDGDTFVAGRNQTTRVYLNVFRNDTRSWTGWMFVGDRKEGDPAVAATSNGEAYIVARDGSYRYWLSRYRPGQGFEDWIYLGGTFATEPAIAAATDDSVYIVGAASNGVVSSGRYVSGSGFQGWVPAGSPPLAAGKPAITVGSDGAAYVAIKATINGISMARLEGNSWGSWYHGGGNIGNGPALAATGGFIYVAVTTPVGAVYVQPFGEGTGNGWQGAWTFLNGHLEGAAIAAAKGHFYIAGRSLFYYRLWWYESGVGWSLLGHPGLAMSDLLASPN
jgi:hypothetical protein